MLKSTRKITLLCLLLILAGMNVHAQRAKYKPQVHQIELQALGADWMSGRNGLTSSFNTPIQLSAVNGIRYQYAHSLANAFRLGFSYNPSEWAGNPVATPGVTNYTAALQQAELRLGYVRRFHTGAIQLYGGADLVGGSGSLAETGTTDAGNYLSEYRFRNYGAAGFAGIRRFVSPYLSVALEAHATYLRFDTPEGNVAALPYSFLGEESFGIGATAFLAFHFVELKKRCSCPKVRRGP
ncbi:MAG: hypothetical protein NWR72_01610 [Bacteroidia bacterium]|nr:hypothetical protein [Bacteroidia bacterium]